MLYNNGTNLKTQKEIKMKVFWSNRLFDYAMEVRDYAKIEKLNALTNPETFWDDVRKLTKNVTSDHSIGRWQCLAEARYAIMTGTNVEV